MTPKYKHVCAWTDHSEFVATIADHDVYRCTNGGDYDGARLFLIRSSDTEYAVWGRGWIDLEACKGGDLGVTLMAMLSFDSMGDEA